MKINNLQTSFKKKVRFTCDISIGSDGFFSTSKPEHYSVVGFVPKEHEIVKKSIEEAPEEITEDYEPVYSLSVDKSKLIPLLNKAIENKQDWIPGKKNDLFTIGTAQLWFKSL